MPWLRSIARHDGRIIKADAFLFCQNVVQIREISALHGGGPFVIVAEIVDNKIVNLFYAGQHVFAAGGQLRSLLYYGALRV
jgi:hypothetical protein